MINWDTYKVYLLQIFALAVTMSDVHLFLTIVLVFLTIVYTIYKIMETESKRRYYKKKKMEEDDTN